jgi:6-pyruvoyltetrahydropterin/6-carboxytetrahydropterin synthase
MGERVRITRRVRFSAAHRYARPEWSDERNQAVFGENVKLHGHNYVLEATVEGPIDPATGMAADIGLLDGALADVARDFGYRDLSTGLAGLDGAIPTTENLALEAWRRVRGRTGDAPLVRVRLFESADLFVEIEAEGGER